MIRVKFCILIDLLTINIWEYNRYFLLGLPTSKKILLVSIIGDLLDGEFKENIIGFLEE